jgi:hypothetical protein
MLILCLGSYAVWLWAGVADILEAHAASIFTPSQTSTNINYIVRDGSWVIYSRMQAVTWFDDTLFMVMFSC